MRLKTLLVSTTLALAVGLGAYTTETPPRQAVTRLPAAPPPVAGEGATAATPAGPALSKVPRPDATTTAVTDAVAFGPAPAPQERKLRAAAEYDAPGGAPVALQALRAPSAPVDRERYAELDPNGVLLVREQPVSTFSIDVDTGAYALVRRHLQQGHLPPTDLVRTEELLNYFRYAYPVPAEPAEPFSITTEAGPTPWNPDTRLVRIGLQGYAPAPAQRPAANLVFLVDVSGSMNQPDKLPLLKNALHLLVDRLRSDDRVSLVVYAGASGVVLEPTAGDQKAGIRNALDQLSAGGPTHGSAGLELAYRTAEQHLVEDGINRVILATDGDFNVGQVNHEALVDLIERKRRSGIALTTLGFGSGNYNDHLMEQLADKGDGNYAYIDNLNEARKVLVDQLGATLQTIARDVKIQVEWNPAQVAEYRLIGYENRTLAREDFNNDRVDAGDIGAGHSVTALYEITLAGSANRRIEPLRYADPTPAAAPDSDELAYVKLRYKLPGAEASRLLERPLRRADLQASLAGASDDFRFAAAVAAFSERLRGGQHSGDHDYGRILELARGARGADSEGYRGEFLGLIKLAESLQGRG